MTTYQRAREALGLRLRELRRDARLTGRQLALQHGWDPSKVSKIENGRQTPSEDNLEAWAQACGRPDLAPELIAALRSLETHYVPYRRLLRTGMTAGQHAFSDLEANATVVCNFESVLISGLLQTPEYARHRLREGVTYDRAPDDLEDAVAARMQRQQVLYRPGKKLHFVLTEASLRYRLCPDEVMVGQLDRLIAMSTVPTIQFGVIPFGARLPIGPLHGFWLFDDLLVKVENFTAAINISQPSEIASYVEVFRRLAEVASYGRDARAIVLRALSDLTASTPGTAEPGE